MKRLIRELLHLLLSSIVVPARYSDRALDMFAENTGLCRKPGETDKQFRKRIVAKSKDTNS